MKHGGSGVTPRIQIVCEYLIRELGRWQMPIVGRNGLSHREFLDHSRADQLDSRQRYTVELQAVPSSPSEFVDWLALRVDSANCGTEHSLFRYMEEEATFADLAYLLYAETPCDYHFVDFVSALLVGLDGATAIEVGANVWDEFGNGDISNTHRKLRLELMAELGLPDLNLPWRSGDFLDSEIRHFTSYGMRALDRDRHVELVGMSAATELLVPAQLSATIHAWRRVGLEDHKMTYLLLHATTDVEHGQGWLDNVVSAILSSTPGSALELALGALTHIDLLDAVYNDVFENLPSRL